MCASEYGTGAAYSFRESVGGVVPGYAGHRPGARDVHHKMAFGGVPTFNDPSIIAARTFSHSATFANAFEV